MRPTKTSLWQDEHDHARKPCLHAHPDDGYGIYASYDLTDVPFVQLYWERLLFLEVKIIDIFTIYLELAEIARLS